ncbi:MAG: hypothetical protein ACFFCW_37280 [Candidatus Hodarchaeota archaeon]
MKKFWVGVFAIILGMLVFAGGLGTVGLVAGWGALPFPLEWWNGILGVLVCLVGIAAFWIPEKSAE